ncbi:hypothetical protein F0562_031250 [Nyssa sinensis]|uniref:Uncharacterized protein n=1 Tax=Nyssa sinensis TaxID=561372 RepID=A0A5J5ARV7_9ASTE|nr:hypothetical protein F0562_031250 [Nyssa sinensis]
MDILMEDLFHFEPLKQFTNGILDPPGVSKPYESWMSQCPGIFDEIEKPTVASNGNFFGQQQGSGVDTMMSPSRVCKPYDSRMPRGPAISDEIETSSLTLNDNLFGQKEGLNMAPIEQIGLGSSSGGDFSSMEKSIGFSTLVPEMEQLPAAGNFRTARKLSFSSSCHPTFPTAAEINSDSNVWISAKNNWKSSREGINQHSDTDFNNDNLPLKHKSLLEEGSMQKTATNFQSLSFQEKDKSQYGGTPLSKAIRSAQPQQGSPWTIEFLNRIREKSRLRQQSLPL